MRILIVDDEPPARSRLRRLLATIPEVRQVTEAGSIEEAIRLIADADVVLLDAQLDGESGFDLFARAGGKALPAVIFVTAYDEFAARAFAVEAADYLLKPPTAPRLLTALQRAQRRSAGASDATGVLPPPLPDRIAVKDRGRVVLLRPPEVESIEADGNYVRLFTTRGEMLHREPLNEFAARIDPTLFVRIHRSTIVNASRVVEVRRWTNGDRIAVMRSGRELRWSRHFKAARRRFLQRSRDAVSDPPAPRSVRRDG